MRSTVILRRLRIPLRIALWSSPLLLAVVLLLAIRGLQEDALVSQARSLLVRGDGATVRELLSDLRRSPWTGRQARAGLELAEALTGAGESSDDPTRLEEVDWDGRPEPDASAFPVFLIIRTAFERGEFPAAQRLIAVAQRHGVKTVPLLEAATWIEAGRVEQAKKVAALGAESLGAVSLGAVSLGAVSPGTMARRVAHHLGTPEEQGGVLLRDRYGRPIGTTENGDMELGVRPELVPRAVTAAVAGHRDASRRDAGRQPAGSLRLTLDLELSEAAFSSFGRYRGSIVILDPASGQILAAVSDRRTWRQGGTSAFEQLREPASIAKLITSTAALRAGYEPDSELRRMRCRGHERYAGKLLYCPSISGRLRGLDRALALSCNVAFANLGVKVGRERLLEEFRRYGFDSRSGLYAGGTIVQARGDDRQLADLAIGLEATTITPLHAALLAAVMANDGVMPEPTLIAAEDGRLGLHPRPLPVRPGHRVIDRRWVSEIVDAMSAVVRGGTAQKVWPPHNFPVAMKTGTASDPRYGFHVNYIGIGPMPEARLAFCVRITDRPTSVKVRRAARQVTYQLLRNLGRIAEQRGWSAPHPGWDRPDRLAQVRTAPEPDRVAALRPAAPLSSISAR